MFALSNAFCLLLSTTKGLPDQGVQTDYTSEQIFVFSMYMVWKSLRAHFSMNKSLKTN